MTNTLKIYEGGKLVEIVHRKPVVDYKPETKRPVISRRAKAKLRNRIGSNQYQTKHQDHWKKTLLVGVILLLIIGGLGRAFKVYTTPKILSPIPEKAQAAEKEAGQSAEVKIASLTPTTTPTATPEPTIEPEAQKSELVEVVAYIAKVFEPEGKEIVVHAINCFYSESGLREEAVGQNNDIYLSKDHGVAQLNDHWHNLTEEEKTDYRANIEKAYKIYKGRGDNFSAWYGKRCN